MSNLEQNLWLIIPPCADRNDWLAAVTPQAEAAGFSVVSAKPDAKDAPIGKTLILSRDADEARKAGALPKDVAVILSDSGPLLPEIEVSDEPAQRHSAVRNASELTRRGHTFPPDRIFLAESFDGTPVEVLPGLKLLRPNASPPSHRNRALKEAFSLYATAQSFWGCEVFDINAKAVRYDDERAVLDLTGRPRILIFGPYIVLPAGRWKAVVRLGFSTPAAKHLYRTDWGTQELYTSYEFRPGREGLFRIGFEYDWDRPAASEFRLLLLEGAFDGEVIFYGVEITRLD